MTPGAIVEDSFRQAHACVVEMIATHRAAAVPALLGAIVEWSVRHGAGELVRDSMNRAVEASYVAEAFFKLEQH